MQYERIKKLEIVERADALKRASERYEIFIAGPFIDINKDADDPVNSEKPGKRLRFSVYNHYKNLGHNLYLGEDNELRVLGDKHYGIHSNAAFYERHYIVNNIDALIVFPDGPGAFCELGDWATTRSTCSKMLIVIDKKYEGQPSYINDGTAKAAVTFGADVRYIDYEDHDFVIEHCDDFIARSAALMRVNELYAR